jgi:hypothetical protein
MYSLELNSVTFKKSSLNFLVLSLKDPQDTPWTNASLVSVLGYPTYGSKPTADAKTSASLFAQAMKNMVLNFEFDYAAAIIKY